MSEININTYDILQLIVDGEMEIVDLLFKQVLMMIRGYFTGIAKNHRINAKSSTEVELIGANDSMPKMLWTLYFNQSPRFYYNEECDFPVKSKRHAA